MVDVQNDFMDGALPAANTIGFASAVHEFVKAAQRMDWSVLYSRDWHPPNHESFRQHGGPWPSHCVAGTFGAQLHADLGIVPTDQLIDKGTRPDAPGYSAFEHTDLGDRIRARGTTEVILIGLTTEYCVSETADDALERGLRVTVLRDLVRPVDIRAQEAVLERLRGKGARISDSQSFIAPDPND